MIQVSILGNSAAIPAFGRYPTSQLVKVNDHYILVDCGEGCQMRLQQYNHKADRIQHIVISHLHGDHYLGLVGLLSSFSLKGRQRDLHVYAPPGLEDIVRLQLPWDLGYTIHYTILTESNCGVIFSNEKFEIVAFPVYHSIPAFGFRITEKKRNRILLPDKARAYNIPAYFYKQLTDGQDYEPLHGTPVKNEWVTAPGLPWLSYVYSGDTRFDPSLATHYANANLLYHETTYLHEQLPKAIERKHTTAAEAAQLARLANVQQLIIGHFSSKYKHPICLLDEAQQIFPNSALALEGITFTIE